MTTINIKSAPRLNLPPADQLAAIVRDVGIAEAAKQLGCGRGTLKDRLNLAGYSITGGPKRVLVTNRGDASPIAAVFQWGSRDWAAHGICSQTDPDEFFPEQGASTRAAKQVCNGIPERDIAPCPVKHECFMWALEHDERGVWGGTDERERDMIRNGGRGRGEAVA